MDTNTTELIARQAGGESLVDELSAEADTFGGRLQVEWDPATPVPQSRRGDITVALTNRGQGPARPAVGSAEPHLRLQS